MKSVLRMFKIQFPAYNKPQNPYRNIDRDIEFLKSWQDRQKGDMKTSKSIAVKYWSDLDEVSDTDFVGFDKRKANLVRQAIRRLKQELRKRFPSVTLP